MECKLKFTEMLENLNEHKTKLPIVIFNSSITQAIFTKGGKRRELLQNIQYIN